MTINKGVHAIIGINNRNLENLEVDIHNTEALLTRYTKGDNIVITESGIIGASDIRRLKNAGADAFLVVYSALWKQMLLDPNCVAFIYDDYRNLQYKLYYNETDVRNDIEFSIKR